ncbi:putative meiotic recombination protein mre11 [Phaeomoniella chlamydospora]|uniref:Double-strand break repair protein n=1 Tax=Phaeomoniella chlamydospora TaxID=158046 RepID=A0A0G2ECE0_PHACM|nr:putative meiotic recombination protein mre11 [Phaeomoniella chlamydospora]
MPAFTEADTIRVLVASDNHVGYNERDPIRGDDSWRSFHEVMRIAKERDVDMVLLAGDLFHENKPSRKSMFQVMRSLRMNCLGDKPCELQFLSDASENFPGAFDHVNYEDLDINVAIPVFSIHGNHDDPSGEGHLAALDLLQVSGLINYYGRTPEADNIHVKPLLMQKGRTKLALYGMSNVRDERLFRTFRDGKVNFYLPSTQKDDWFNLLAVHQNHHAHTETSYLPEHFLPEFMDLVVWGHEHECEIDPRLNPDTSFRVMQPGSSVATSLVPGEAKSKHVAILSITGRDFTSENVRLKTVRPFVMKEIALQDDPAMRKISRKNQNRAEVTNYLVKVVEQLIEQAKEEWLETREPGDEDEDESSEPPLPLIRLRVEISAPEGGTFDVENPQRFSNKFATRVANTNDVVQFYRSKKNLNILKKVKADDLASEEAMSHLEGLDIVRIEKLVREFLAAQTLTILPQNTFSDAVGQFIDKDDKHAMEAFVNDSLSNQVKHLMALNKSKAGDDDDDDLEDEEEEDDLLERMGQFRSQLEVMFEKGQVKRPKTRKFKPKPDFWDSDFEGHWEDQPGSLLIEDGDGLSSRLSDEEEPGTRGSRNTTRGSTTRARGGRGRGRGAASSSTTTTSTRKPAATSKKKTGTSTTGRSAGTRNTKRRRLTSDEEDEESYPIDQDSDDPEEPFSIASSDHDIPMRDERLSASDDDDGEGLFIPDNKKPTKSSSTRSAAQTRNSRKPPTTTTTRKATASTNARTQNPPPTAKQSTLNFGASQASVLGGLSQSQSLGSKASIYNSRSGTGTGTGTLSNRRTNGKVEVIEDDDDDDAFESVPPSSSVRSRRR